MNTGKINTKEYQKIFKICKIMQKELKDSEKVTVDYLEVKKKVQEQYPSIEEETIQLALDDMELKGYIISSCR